MTSLLNTKDLDQLHRTKLSRRLLRCSPGRLQPGTRQEILGKKSRGQQVASIILPSIWWR